MKEEAKHNTPYQLNLYNEYITGQTNLQQLDIGVRMI